MLIGADVRFTAWHTNPSPLLARDARAHPHDWIVTCWVEGDPWRDAEVLRAAMTEVLAHLGSPADGRPGEIVLPPERWSNEAIAKHFAILMGVVEVEVDRDGYHARLVL